MTDDVALLERYALTGANDAFTLLVRRHIDFVYATALRLTRGDTAMAEDATQMVFIDLARKAVPVSRHPALEGWLHTATRFAALRLLRSDRRRQLHERAATLDPATSSASEANLEWGRLQPVIDDVLSVLKDRERTAVLLRFFRGRKIAEVGAQLALSETAARACLDRALEKMQRQLARRGITSTGAAIGLVLANQIAVAAPPGLAVSVTSTALAAATAGSGAIFASIFTMSKLSTIVAGGIIVAGLATAVVEWRTHHALQAELGVLRSAAGDPAQLLRQNQQQELALNNLAADDPAMAELTRLRHRADVLRGRPHGVLDSELKAARSWRNAGRATPEAAQETLHWALSTGNLSTAASLIVFRDDSKESRAAFMAQCSDAIRNRYQTPEQVVAAGLFGVGSSTTSYSPNDAYEVLSQDDHVGGDGSRYGQVRIRVWYQLADGRAFEGDTRWQPTPDGWALGAFELAPGGKVSDSALLALSQLDPATGNHLTPNN